MLNSLGVTTTSLSAFAINCSLKSTEAAKKTSTDKMIDDLLAAMKPYGVTGKRVRAADYNIKPGVLSDEGTGDDWPELREQVLATDIFVFATPIWMGQPSSIAKRILERMDAFLSETDDRQRMPTAGKVAVVAIVGNEDGAHHCHAECFQALNDVGFSIPANAGAYWVGEAMQSINYIDLPQVPEKVAEALRTLASNAAHLAKVLKSNAYPGVSETQ